MKKVSEDCLKKLKEFEGFRKEAYLDAAGVPTIGYGHTLGVRMGDVISEYWADMLLKADLYDIEKQVETLGDWNQPQFDALVSFAFNLGFYKLKTSTLMQTILEGGTLRLGVTGALPDGTTVVYNGGALAVADGVALGNLTVSLPKISPDTRYTLATFEGAAPGTAPAVTVEGVSDPRWQVRIGGHKLLLSYTKGAVVIFR